jgi:capsular exopolysaccharide synthesis family protein
VELRLILRLVRDHWKSMVLLVLIGTATASLLVMRQTPRYAASTTLYVSSHGDQNNAASAYQGSLLSQQEASTYAHLVLSKRVLDADPSLDRTNLAGRVTASVVPDTALLTITAVDVTPAGAQHTANAVANSFVTVLPSLSGTVDGNTPAVTVSVVSDASLPTSPVWPRPALSIGLGALAGLVAGAALTAARHSLDLTVKSMDQAHQVTNAPALGTVPADPTTRRSPLALREREQRGRGEALRKICASLRFLDLEQRHGVLLVTSVASQEGKTTTACNLALTLARAGRRVILVDGDLRRPQVASYLGLPAGIGLTSVLLGTAGPADAIQSWGEDLFAVLASGPVPPNPAEMLGSQRMVDLLAHLRDEYDYVIVDAAPVLPVADATVAAAGCDGVIMVARHGKTRRDQLQQAASTMRDTQTPVLGVVLNRVPARGPSGPYYYYAAPHHAARTPRPAAATLETGPLTTEAAGRRAGAATEAGR